VVSVGGEFSEGVCVIPAEGTGIGDELFLVARFVLRGWDGEFNHFINSQPITRYPQPARRISQNDT
jgi:hypothetical protein